MHSSASCCLLLWQLVEILPPESLTAGGVGRSGALIAAKLPRAAVAYMARFEVNKDGKLEVSPRLRLQMLLIVGWFVVVRV